MKLGSVQKINCYRSIDTEINLADRNDYIGIMGFSTYQVGLFFSSSFMVTGEADYDKMIKQNGVIINDSENLLKQFYGYTPQMGDGFSKDMVAKQ